MKTAEYRTPDRMKADTLHKGFNRICDYVGTGNVISNVQRSGFIRAHTDTECNGHTFKPGELQAFDLKPFAPVAWWVRKHAAEKSVILYKFVTGKTVHGYIMTDCEHRMIGRYETGPTRKSRSVLDFVSEFITKP